MNKTIGTTAVVLRALFFYPIRIPCFISCRIVKAGGASVGAVVVGVGVVQYPTYVKNLLFVSRLEFLCKTLGCVPHYF